MNTVSDIEQQILALSPTEREQVAALAWDSVASDAGLAGDPAIDREGVEVAKGRDEEIERGAIRSIGHAEFLRRTGGVSK